MRYLEQGSAGYPWPNARAKPGPPDYEYDEMQRRKQERRHKEIAGIGCASCDKPSEVVLVKPQIRLWACADCAEEFLKWGYHEEKYDGEANSDSAAESVEQQDTASQAHDLPA